MEALLPWIMLVGLLLLSSILHVSENGFLKLTLQHFEEKKNLSATDVRARSFVEEPVYLLITYHFLKLLFILGSVFLILHLFSQWVSDQTNSFFYILLVTILILYVFIELIPFFFMRCSPLTCFKLAFPIIIPVEWVVRKLSFIFPFSRKHYSDRLEKKDVISLSDIGEAIEHAEMESDDEEVERQWVKGVLNFKDLEVSDIMQSRLDIVAVNIQWSLPEVLRLMVNAGYSRFPVYNDNLDNIVGIIYLKDIFTLLPENKENWKEKIREPYFVPENLKLSKLLIGFQQRKIHMAIVVDEYGSTSGLVTLEDIFEEIVGEINDEHDQDSDQIIAKKLDDSTYIFDAKISIHDFLKVTGFDEDFFDGMNEEVETLAGILLLLNGDFPVKNQTIPFKNVSFIIMNMYDYRIGTVKMIIHEKTDDEK
jgi:CBS domain containing-hemolysin-like protein